jgi:hypothetical protein
LAGKIWGRVKVEPTNYHATSCLTQADSSMPQVVRLLSTESELLCTLPDPLIDATSGPSNSSPRRSSERQHLRRRICSIPGIVILAREIDYQYT